MRQTFLLLLSICIFSTAWAHRTDSLAIASSEGDTVYSTNHPENTLTPETTTSGSGGTPTTSAAATRVHALYDQVLSQNRLVDQLDFSQPILCPMGITRNLGGIEYCVVIESIQYQAATRSGSFNASMSVRLPGCSTRIAFRGTNIAFDASGITGGEGRLTLLDNVSIPFGSSHHIALLGNRGLTYITFGCGGYKNISIDAELALGTDQFQAVDSQGNPSGAPAKATFTGTFDHWGKMVVTVQLTPFQLRSLPGYIFTVTDATYDNSDELNPLGIQYPVGYTRTGEGPLWKGVYIRNFSIAFPRQFQRTDGVRPSITVGAAQVLIDEHGFTGFIYATNLIPLDKGNLSSWKYAIDSLGLHITLNQVQGLAFSGRVHIPQMGEDASPLRFSAFLAAEDNYIFNIALTGKQKFTAVLADLTLLPTSSITIGTIQGQFRPRANLHGTLSIKSSGTELVGLGFEGLQFQTIAPYVTIAGASLTSPNIKMSVKNFEITLRQISFRTRGSRFGLGFTIDVHRTKTDKLGLNGTGAFTIWGKQELDRENQFVYRYDRLDMDGLSINIDRGAFKKEGSVV